MQLLTSLVVFDTSADTFSFGLGAGDGTTYVEAGAAVADLATLLSDADTALDGTVVYYVGQVTGGDSYLVVDTDGNGYTDVIQLSGVALTGIEAADIVA